MNKTLTYYSTNAQDFISSTRDVDFRSTQDRFLQKLSPSTHILDFGCGSGRDIKYFLEQGFQVTAIDGSEEMCRLASQYTGIEVKRLLFQELNEINAYDGIWACSSILHLPYEELKAVILKIFCSLKKNGILYASFKYGEFEGERNGRYFTDMTEQKIEKLRNETAVFVIEEQWITSDVRPGRDAEKWLNLILQKI